ncbi:transposase [Porphyromonadaceae sp. NP-X]|nr:transposase [Porphyromonadaceae sp. NP-X]
MKTKVNKYTDDFKLMVVQDYLSSDISQSALKKKYNFGGNKNIYNWMRKFGLSKPSEGKKELHQVMAKEEQKSALEQELELKISKLEEELKREQLRTKALNVMIDIAERDLKVDIRKKSGAKR